MHKLTTFLTCLLGLTLVACNQFALQNQTINSATLQPECEETSSIGLASLDTNTPEDQWEQFFQARGALAVWQELQKKVKD